MHITCTLQPWALCGPSIVPQVCSDHPWGHLLAGTATGTLSWPLNCISWRDECVLSRNNLRGSNWASDGGARLDEDAQTLTRPLPGAWVSYWSAPFLSCHEANVALWLQASSSSYRNRNWVCTCGWELMDRIVAEKNLYHHAESGARQYGEFQINTGIKPTNLTANPRRIASIQLYHGAIHVI
jgi:hypothetical protein